MQETILRIDHVVKRYKNKTAVDAVEFEVRKGSIFGLLGPNGAGKTSLIRIITTITGADEGKVYFNGEELNGFHPTQIGYLPEERGLYKKMKVGDQLMYLAQLKGLSQKAARESILGWMDKFDIRDWWHKKIEELSKGMQQKIQFIATVMHDPKLIILDEPFTGLDPINTDLIKAEIHELKEKGASIIFSTHRMEQVEEICEDIVLIDDGKVILEGKVADIKQDFKENIFEVGFAGQLDVDSLNGNIELVEKSGDRMRFKLNEGVSSNQFLNHLMQQGIELLSFNEILPSLNEIFIKKVEENDVV
jgi:ABC-2 type transport system ATP-binding protein